MDDQQSPLEETPLSVLSQPVIYVCPGEDHPIPRPVHLSRLAAYYPKCRECEHRHDTGQLPRSTVGRLQQTAARIVRPSPFGPEGVRGEYLNHLNRQLAGRVAAAVADSCWQSQPLIGRSADSTDDEERAAACPPASAPLIVIGHDARPSAPDLCVGVSSSLRRMGCEVVDVGRVSAPCHVFAVDHLQADAGLFVTGHGCEPRWIGLDLIGPRGVPWSLGDGGHAACGTLRDIERRYLAGVSRPTRQAGSQRYFDAILPYRALLLKHFRDLRPLRIVCASPDPFVDQTLQQIFEPLPCDLIAVAAPRRSGDSAGATGADSPELRTAIKQTDAACGIVIADDGRGIDVFDEQGKPVEVARLLASLINGHRGARHLAVCVLHHDEVLFEQVSAQVGLAHRVRAGREALVRQLFEPTTGFGIENGGRLWLQDSPPVCDAILTIGLLLRTLSRTGEPLSAMSGAE